MRSATSATDKPRSMRALRRWRFKLIFLGILGIPYLVWYCHVGQFGRSDLGNPSGIGKRPVYLGTLTRIHPPFGLAGILCFRPVACISYRRVQRLSSTIRIAAGAVERDAEMTAQSRDCRPLTWIGSELSGPTIIVLKVLCGFPLGGSMAVARAVPSASRRVRKSGISRLI